MFRYLLPVVFLGAVFGGVGADEKPGAPKAAKTTAEIVKWAESAAKGFDTASTVEFRDRDARTFIVWYNPYSGRAGCHLHGYKFDAKQEQWIRFRDRVFEGTHDVSVEVGRVLTIRDVKGNVIYKDKSPN